MENIVSFLHSGKLGDCIASMSAVKEFCEKNNVKAHIVLDPTGGLDVNGTGKVADAIRCQLANKPLIFGINACNYIKPLLEAQDYIKSVEIYDKNKPKPVDINLNFMRVFFLQKRVIKETGTNLELMYKKLLKLPLVASEKWLNVQPLKYKKSIGIARSVRYTSAHLWLSGMATQLQREAFFIGTDFEHTVFKEAFGVELDHVKTANALEAAQLIAGTDLFIANGTLHYWIAIGVGHKNIINELGVDIPTTYYNDNKRIRYIQGGKLFN